jgi:serine protease Do
MLFSCSHAGPATSRAGGAIGAQQADSSDGSGAAPVLSPSAGQPPAVRVSDTFDAPQLEQQFELVARRVSPAVVAISATDSHLDTDDTQRSEDLNAEKLSNVLDTVDRTVGTGFVIDPEGYIVTNEHVVGKAEQVWVTMDDRKVYPALVVGSDPRSDLAVLKIPAHNLPTVKFAQGDACRGQWAVAIGNPYGLAGEGEMAVSIGVVSATGRSLPKLSGKEDRLYSDLIQTTAQINPGNSGGPLFDIHGDVIGVNTAVILPQKQTNGIGFAMPADRRLKEVVQDLKDGREVIYAYLGVKVAMPTFHECREAGLAAESGARVELVEPGSPADEAKLKVGDIVIRLSDDTVRDADQFVRAVGGACVSAPVNVVLYRGGSTRTVTLNLRRRELTSTAVTRDSQRLHWHGLLLGPAPAHWSGPANSATAAANTTAVASVQKKPAAGLMVIAVDPNCPLAKEGIVQGSVITTVAGKPVSDVTTLQQIINDVPPEKCVLGLAEGTKAVVSAQETP